MLEAGDSVVLINISAAPNFVQDMLVLDREVEGARLVVDLPTTFKFEAADGSATMIVQSGNRRRRILTRSW